MFGGAANVNGQLVPLNSFSQVDLTLPDLLWDDITPATGSLLMFFFSSCP
jgi:hypothetical protein